MFILRVGALSMRTWEIRRTSPKNPYLVGAIEVLSRVMKFAIVSVPV
jgi:hypothetical protein